MKTDRSIKSSLIKVKSKKKKRVGRGPGSGKGKHTAGRGQKGQRSRAGFKHRRAFEGGQKPLNRKLPRVSGNKPVSKKPLSVKIDVWLSREIYEINEEDVKSITGEIFVKILGMTDYSSYDLSKVKIGKGVLISNALKTKIEEAKGTVQANQ